MDLVTNRQSVHDIMIKPVIMLKIIFLEQSVGISPNVKINNSNIKYNETYWENFKII